MAELYIGTSGWNYQHWRGVFYRRGLGQKDFLCYYASRFTSVELSESFQHLPSEADCEAWSGAVPDGFIFSVIVSKSITHGKRLKGGAASWNSFLERVRFLGDKLGPLLLQLPPTLKCDIGALERFLEAVPEARTHRLALEARHASWFDPLALYDLRRLGIAAVISHSERYPEAPNVPTADFVYLRFHGPGSMFSSRYSASELEPWSARIRKWLDEDRAVFAYFANDFEGNAIANAKTLRQMVEGSAVSRSAATAPH